MTRITRRTFLRSTAAMATAAAAGPLILPSRSALGYAANERLNVAIVGVGGYAAAAAFIPALHVYENVRFSALCDVDESRVAETFETFKDRARAFANAGDRRQRRAGEQYQAMVESPPPVYEDYRVMLEKFGDEIDAVVCATPDHTHACIAAECVYHGKHVLAEKPLTITAHDGHALQKLSAANPAIATAMGNQGTQSPQFRRGIEIIREGILGDIRQVHVFYNHGGANFQDPPRNGHEVPDGFNWNLWLGPPAWREYHPEWINRIAWRDTSIGQLGNFGPHTANLAFMALNLRELWERDADAAASVEVEAECSHVNSLSYPTWERINWHVPARGAMPPVTFTWHHGPGDDYAPGSRELFTNTLREHGATDEDIERMIGYAGAIIMGSEGILVTDSHNTNITLMPREKFSDVATNRPEDLSTSRGHYNDWIHACRGGDEPWTNFGYSGPFSAFLAVGDVATQFPENKLTYDPMGKRITNHADAHAALSYEYREGWRV